MGETPIFTDRIKDHNKRGAWGWSIFQLTEGHCSYCGKLLIFTELWHLDHKIPRASGGRWKGNLVPACPLCNIRKSSWELSEFKNWIKKKLWDIYFAASGGAKDFCVFLLPDDRARIMANIADIRDCIEQAQIVFYSDAKQGGE